jgi:hypothetical protein
MANNDKLAKRLSDLIDNIERIREELLTIQRSMEKMEILESSPRRGNE